LLASMHSFGAMLMDLLTLECMLLLNIFQN
jgi:hypothetical protein